MTTLDMTDSVSRRTALARIGAGSLGLTLAARNRGASAQDATPPYWAGHPNVGVWLVDAPVGPALAIFAADGTNVQAVPATQAGPQGVNFVSTEVGTWEPTGERSVHFTAVQLLSDANGTFTGTVTIDAHHTVSEDGQSFVSDPSLTSVTIRDAAHNVVDVITGGPPATGIRMGVGAPGFPAAPPAAATPAT